MAVLASIAAICVAVDYPALGPIYTPAVHRVPTRCSRPSNLDEAHQVLAQLLAPDLVAELRAGSEQGRTSANVVVGRELRNIWGLWNGSVLRDDLVTQGLRHADEMAELILVTFGRYLNGEPQRMAEEVTRLRARELRPTPQCPPCIHGGTCTTARVLDARLGRDRGFLVRDCCCGFRPQIVEGAVKTIASTGEVVVDLSMVPLLYDLSCRDSFGAGS